MTAPSLVHLPAQELQSDTWEVETLGRQPGLTRVSHAGGDVQVRVGDLAAGPRRPGSEPGPTLRSLLSARLAADGTAHVTARFAPPALVLTADGVRLVPGDATTRGSITMAPGDLLVMRSAAVLDAEPQVLVELLEAGPGSARGLDLADLVRQLLVGSFAGAAAVARFGG